ncbi:MAG: hypothetical protein ACRD51_06650 [Candidatus Acidiferrum sp.]
MRSDTIIRNGTVVTASDNQGLFPNRLDSSWIERRPRSAGTFASQIHRQMQ